MERGKVAKLDSQISMDLFSGRQRSQISSSGLEQEQVALPSDWPKNTDSQLSVRSCEDGELDNWRRWINSDWDSSEQRSQPTVSNPEERGKRKEESSRTRAPNWQPEEELVKWKLCDDKLTFEKISQLLGKKDYKRTGKQCERKWDGKRKEWIKIRNHESGDGKVTSYWNMKNNEREGSGLPKAFTRELYNHFLRAEGNKPRNRLKENPNQVKNSQKQLVLEKSGIDSGGDDIINNVRDLSSYLQDSHKRGKETEDCTYNVQSQSLELETDYFKQHIQDDSINMVGSEREKEIESEENKIETKENEWKEERIKLIRENLELKEARIKAEMDKSRAELAKIEAERKILELEEGMLRQQGSM